MTQRPESHKPDGTCHAIVNVLGDSCTDMADRLVGQDRWSVPLCGMHAMRHKPADGFSNEPLPEYEEVKT